MLIKAEVSMNEAWLKTLANGVGHAHHHWHS